MEAQKGGGGPNLEHMEGPKGGEGGLEGWGPERVEPTISRFFFFFSFSHLKLHSLCSLWLSFRVISVVFEVLGPSKMHVWSALGHDVRNPGGPVSWNGPGFQKKRKVPKRVSWYFFWVHLFR